LKNYNLITGEQVSVNVKFVTESALEQFIVPLNQAPDFEEPQSLEFVIELPKATQQET